MFVPFVLKSHNWLHSNEGYYIMTKFGSICQILTSLFSRNVLSESVNHAFIYPLYPHFLHHKLWFNCAKQYKISLLAAKIKYNFKNTADFILETTWSEKKKQCTTGILIRSSSVLSKTSFQFLTCKWEEIKMIMIEHT